MGKYVIKRLWVGVVTLFVLATITFFLMHAIPDSPFAGETAKLSPGIRTAVTEFYGLDEPLYVQYIKYLGNVIRGDFGTSLSHNGRSVQDIIKLDIAVSARLGTVAFCIAVVMGIVLGMVSAFAKHRWVKDSVAFVATVGASIPSFLLALIMIMIFGVTLRWLPTVGLSTWRHYIMPGLALAMAPLAMISRLTRNSLTEVMKQDYIVLAKSKGTASLTLIARHAAKNALTPVITYAGPLLASLLTGSFVIETLFSVPGLGAEFVSSVANRDYTMIMALTVYYGAIVISFTIVTDLITAALDPRIRLK